jgi:hypothetical protein
VIINRSNLSVGSGYATLLTDNITLQGSENVTIQSPSSIEFISPSITLTGDIRSESAINIDINLSDSTLRRWRFGEDGDLSLPGGGLLGQVWGDGVDNELTLKSPTAGGNAAYVALSSANEQNYVEVSNEGVVLAVGFSTEEFKKLTFGTDGNIKSLDSVPLQILSTGSSGAVSMAWSSSVNSPENIALVIANSPGATTSGAVDIVVGALAEPNIWTFSPDGSLTLPGDIKSESAINIDINLSDSTLRRWRFGEDGDLTFPDATTQTTAFTGNAATIDITDTNGIDTNYYLTFVENRDGGEILRADVDLIFNSADNTLTAGNITTGVLKIDDGVHEQFQTKADATGVVTHDCALGHIIYHTSPDANWTVNLTNLNLDSGYATTVTIIIDQGGTGYYPNALQINGGSSMSINWQGNVNPTPSTNRTDVVSFSILALSEGYLLLGQLTGF